MKKLNSNKGQTALESAFVVLFIILAVGVIMNLVLIYGSNIERMATARAVSQGVAMELTMRGTITHLIRVDPNPAAIPPSVDLYVMSEGCTTGTGTTDVKNKFGNTLSAAGIGLSTFRCEPGLFKDEKFKEE